MVGAILGQSRFCWQTWITIKMAATATKWKRTHLQTKWKRSSVTLLTTIMITKHNNRKDTDDSLFFHLFFFLIALFIFAILCPDNHLPVSWQPSFSTWQMSAIFNIWPFYSKEQRKSKVLQTKWKKKKKHPFLIYFLFP